MPGVRVREGTKPSFSGKRLPSKPTTNGVHSKAVRSRVAALKQVAKQGGVRKPRKFRPGTVALRRIKQFQRSTTRVVPAAAVKRLISRVMQWLRLNGPRVMISPAAAELVHEYLEDKVIQNMSEAQLLSIHGKRVTVFEADMRMAARLNPQLPAPDDLDRVAGQMPEI